MESKAKKNNMALMVGFFLILVVAALTFIKPTLKQEKTVEKNISQSSSETDNGIGIDSEALFNMLKDKTNISIIDIRSDQEYKKEHILDSKNIAATNLAEALPSFSKDIIYVIVSNSYSQQDIDYLKKIFSESGINNYHYLMGGFSDWKNKYQLTISDGDPKSFIDQSKVTYISADDLKKQMDSKENNLLIIDLRKSSSYSDGHIRNSINIYLDDIENQYKKITPGKKIILYDKDGLWAFKGAVRLNDLGVYNVSALTGGLDEWKKKGYETIK